MSRNIRKRIAWLLALTFLGGCAAPAATSGNQASPQPHAAATRAGTMTVTAPALYTKNSYRGQPDLGLVVALVSAGGGQHFRSDKLLSVLTEGKPGPAVDRLQRRYGKARIAAFMQTFTFAMTDLLQLFIDNHVALPANPRVSPNDGKAMALAIYHDGIMPTGKYDCGYMMEHLMTHPIHVVLMHDINNRRGFGASHNASFHEILTATVMDLKNSYRGSST